MADVRVERLKSSQPSDLHCVSQYGRHIYVWCKAYTVIQQVGDPIVRVALGAVQTLDPASIVMIVTTSTFSPRAYVVAKEYNDRIRLINVFEFVEMMQHVEP